MDPHEQVPVYEDGLDLGYLHSLSLFLHSFASLMLPSCGQGSRSGEAIAQRGQESRATAAEHGGPHAAGLF